jgi:hypothetical protein
LQRQRALDLHAHTHTSHQQGSQLVSALAVSGSQPGFCHMQGSTCLRGMLWCL